MSAKEFIANVFSRKSSIAAVAIMALCYIAMITNGGQVDIDKAGAVSIVPMSPELPAAGQAVDWKIPAEITLIACMAIVAQAILDYLRPRGGSLIAKLDVADIQNQN